MKLRPFLLLISLAFPIIASPIAYTVSGELTGSLNGTPLNDDPFAFTFYSDTADVLTDGFGLFYNDLPTSTSVDVSGFSPGSFTQGVDISAQPAVGFVGFGATDTSGAIAIELDGFEGWDANTSIGPLEEVGTPYYQTGIFQTTIGTLTITSAANVSFGAVVTPEPSTRAAVFIAFLAIVVLRRRLAGT